MFHPGECFVKFNPYGTFDVYLNLLFKPSNGTISTLLAKDIIK